MDELTVNADRLHSRIQQLGEIGAIDGGGVCRLALSEEDRRARDLFMEWLENGSSEIQIDRIGNIIGVRKGRKELPAVMAGSHLDTVVTGGRYDGSLGVVVALEVLEVLEEHNIVTDRPYAVVNFTNEEGVRFTPGMMGSAAFAGLEQVERLLAAPAVDGSVTVSDALDTIGYGGDRECGSLDVDRFLELHIEQGPVLEEEEKKIAAVDRVQGIYWTEYRIKGEAGHAGTTPLDLRRDAGYVAAEINRYIRRMTTRHGGVGTVGFLELAPNATNVIPKTARFRVDFRHPDPEKLSACQNDLDAYVEDICSREGTSFERRELIRVDPVSFDRKLVDVIMKQATALGYEVKRMASGAGHDAQMMAGRCPSAMLFVPSVNGISHNVNEFTRPGDIVAGANVMLQTIMDLLNR